MPKPKNKIKISLAPLLKKNEREETKGTKSNGCCVLRKPPQSPPPLMGGGARGWGLLTWPLCIDKKVVLKWRSLNSLVYDN